VAPPRQTWGNRRAGVRRIEAIVLSESVGILSLRIRPGVFCTGFNRDQLYQKFVDCVENHDILYSVHVEEVSAPMEGKFVFAAAQVPFATAEGFHFCTLVPICNIDGDPVNAHEDFPNTGLCWFMLRDVRFQGLTPGQLVIGPVEHTRDWSTADPDKHWFQLRVDTAQMGGSADTVLEVLEAGLEELDGPHALIRPQRKIYVDHRPTDLVIVRLGQRFMDRSERRRVGTTASVMAAGAYRWSGPAKTKSFKPTTRSSRRPVGWSRAERFGYRSGMPHRPRPQ